jgi:aspartate/methionine/tyrosine aminotransferase
MRKAIVEKYRREDDVEYNPNNEIIVTASGKVALYIAFATLVEPEDEVLLLEPAWVSYRPVVHLLGEIALGVSLTFEDNYLVKDEVLKNMLPIRRKR